MNVMYVAPRYHTNQIPIMRGWVEKGDKVSFVSQYQGKTEDYAVLTPIILGYSAVFNGINKLFAFFLKKNPKISNIENFQTHYGFPARKKVRQLLRELTPELIIFRDRNLYTVTIYHEACKMQIPCILYNQTPYWETEELKNDLLHKMIRKNCPKFRITPVWGNEEKGKVVPNSYYVPFVMDLEMSIEEKTAQRADSDQKIRILCIGKYETRKNQLMLLEVFSKLVRKYPMELTLVGEVSTGHHRAYYDKVCTYIDENNLNNNVFTKVNLSRKEVCEEYSKADIFVLPSTKEFASVSQLEAMAYSLPVICSDKNGTASYVKDGINGFLFTDNDSKSLQEALEKILQNREQMTKMGQNSYELVKNIYGFEPYYEKILYIKQKIENERNGKVNL